MGGVLIDKLRRTLKPSLGNLGWGLRDNDQQSPPILSNSTKEISESNSGHVSIFNIVMESKVT